MKDRGKPKASITALSVLNAFIYGASGEFQHLFDEEDVDVAKHILHTVISREPTLNYAGMTLFTSMPYKLQSCAMNYLLNIDHYSAHMVGRKYMIREKINAAIHDGATQIIFLGGGYDGRAYLSAKRHPHIKHIELDRGVTRMRKLEALSELNHMPPQNFHSIECDLMEDDLNTILTELGFNPHEKTLVIAEGLTTYLSEERVMNLMDTVGKLLLNDESELLLSFSYQNNSLHTSNKIESYAISAASESYLFELAPEATIPFCNRAHFTVCEKLMGREIISEMTDIIIPADEKIREENYFLLRPSDVGQVNDIAAVPTMQELVHVNDLILGVGGLCCHIS